MPALKAHPYADLFPMMNAAELEALTEDIAANGLRQPLVRYQGRLLDGRNRQVACEKAGVEPTFTDYDGDDAGALALVISLNVQRRDLTAGQRAIVAAKAMERYPHRWGGDRRSDQAGKSSPLGRKREDAAREFKVSDKSVQQARTLLAEAPDLAAQVESCTCNLAFAYDQLQGRRLQVKQKAKDAERVSEYADAISNGEIRLEEALQCAIEQERAEKEKQAAAADACREWLRGFAESLAWQERCLDAPDEYLSSYFHPESPGSFEHGITPQRIAKVIELLERALTHNKEASHGHDHQPKRKARN